MTSGFRARRGNTHVRSADNPVRYLPIADYSLPAADYSMPVCKHDARREPETATLHSILHDHPCRYGFVGLGIDEDEGARGAVLAVAIVNKRC